MQKTAIIIYGTGRTLQINIAVDFTTHIIFSRNISSGSNNADFTCFNIALQFLIGISIYFHILSGLK